MSSVGRGRGDQGGCGGSPPLKRRHDDEVGSSSFRPAVEEWRKVQARVRGALSRSGGRNAWSSFDEVRSVLWPTTKGLREGEIEIHAAKEAVAAREDMLFEWAWFVGTAC